MKLKTILPFDWAHGGVKVEHFPVGAEIETEDEDLARVSTGEGWTVEVSAVLPPVTSPEQVEEVPVDPLPDVVQPDSAETPAAPKRGRAAK